MSLPRGTAAAGQTREVPPQERAAVSRVIEASFHGIYRWHALRTLQSVETVRAAFQGATPLGLVMYTRLQPGLGYVYYVAVDPACRSAGLGGRLLDEALARLGGAGAREVLACIRADNRPSVRLFESRGFARTGFLETARRGGVRAAVRLWRRMVVAPGEGVYRATLA